MSEPPHWKGQDIQGSDFGDTAEGGCGSDRAIPERYNVVYHSTPDPATVVEALPGYSGDQAQMKRRLANAGEYLRRKRAAMYAWRSIDVCTSKKQCDQSESSLIPTQTLVSRFVPCKPNRSSPN